METEIKTAIELLAKKITSDLKSEDALRFTQAALNLAHVAATVANTKANYPLSGTAAKDAMPEPTSPVTNDMVSRFLAWKLPADFAPDCGISFKPESDYAHPEFGRTKFEPTGTNLLHAGQARAMLEHILSA